ncbi:unnamed protein product [Effrenium voratum]|nr:unnamed protein product [Effrenium voratum]
MGSSSAWAGKARSPRKTTIGECCLRNDLVQESAGLRREGACEADAQLTEQEVFEESIRLSRMEFEHKSDAEMDSALQDSRADWEKSERKRMEEEVVDAILQQSVLEEEQKQLSMAMKESKDEVIESRPDFAALYGLAARFPV